MTDSLHVLARCAATLAAAALALAACGTTDTRSTAGDPASDPAAHDDPSSHAPEASLTVSTTSKPGRKGMLFTEGAVPEVRLVGADGTAYRPVQDHTDTARFTSLVPGDYTLRAAQRPCDGNCGYLDPPTGRCSGTVHVEGESRASVMFVVGRACTVTA